MNKQDLIDMRADDISRMLIALTKDLIAKKERPFYCRNKG